MCDEQLITYITNAIAEERDCDKITNFKKPYGEGIIIHGNKSYSDTSMRFITNNDFSPIYEKHELNILAIFQKKCIYDGIKINWSIPRPVMISDNKQYVVRITIRSTFGKQSFVDNIDIQMRPEVQELLTNGELFCITPNGYQLYVHDYEDAETSKEMCNIADSIRCLYSYVVIKPYLDSIVSKRNVTDTETIIRYVYSTVELKPISEWEFCTKRW